MPIKKVAIYADCDKWPRVLTPEQVDTVLKFVDSRPDFKDKPFADKRDIQRLWDEIPVEAKPTASAILTICKFMNEHGIGSDSYSCLLFRCIFYSVIEDTKKKNGLELPVTRGWWTDGPHMEPDFVVRVTNGIVRWKGDMSCKMCHGGPEGNCPYRLTEDDFNQMDNEADKADHDRVRKVLEDLL
jgi:hypothetical protein